MTRLTQADVEQAFAKLIRAASRALDGEVEWTLDIGDRQNKEQWKIRNNRWTVHHLGWTRRQAYDGINAMTAAFEVVIDGNK